MGRSAACACAHHLGGEHLNIGVGNPRCAQPRGEVRRAQVLGLPVPPCGDVARILRAASSPSPVATRTPTIWITYAGWLAFKPTFGPLPESGDDLTSQPTVSRWESAPDLRTLIRPTRAAVDLCRRSYRCATKAIILDIDVAADTVHGHQLLDCEPSSTWAPPLKLADPLNSYGNLCPAEVPTGTPSPSQPPTVKAPGEVWFIGVPSTRQFAARFVTKLAQCVCINQH